MNDQQIKLKRSISLPLITFYGLGNILGAGIYVLIGKVAGEAGMLAPLAFFVASIIAAISAFTYAEMSARYPTSAGEAVYLYEAFHNLNLSRIVGLLITLAGIVSAAAIANGFAGYLQVFFDIPSGIIIPVLLLSLGILAAWGIEQSLKGAALLTIIEMAGLLIIIVMGADHIPDYFSSTEVYDQISMGASGVAWAGVMSGAFLAFYAYIGFEDMVNVAEEVKQPEKNLPRAIFLAVIISTLLYAAVSIVAVNTVPPAQLSTSDAPLATVYTELTGRTPVLITIIGLFAVVNGALIQLIMASRLLYGMAARNWLPARLSVIHPLTRTPVNSTVLVVGIMLVFALLFPITTLAGLTSYLVLSVFALVNLALIRIKKSVPGPDGVPLYPAWIPVVGFITTVSFLIYSLIANFL